MLIRNVPHMRQKPDFCGEAVAASFAQALGARYEQDDVFDLSGMDPARGMGATTRELRTALERMGFRKRLPPRFHLVIEPPFVVIGDDTPEGVEAHARAVVRWAVRLLEREYFTCRPRTILDIWLFKDQAGYDANVARLFAGSPDTPFGFYSKQYGALVMNIATGGGTLVHEIGITPELRWHHS